MKSAWERALEKLDDAGIDRPDQTAVSDEAREQLNAVRSKAEAQLAELEIMFKKAQATNDPTALEELSKNYQGDRDGIESKRDTDLQRIRG